MTKSIVVGGGYPDVAPVKSASSANVGELVTASTDDRARKLQLARDACNGKQARYAELYVVYNNKCRAYREVYGDGRADAPHDYSAATYIHNTPSVRAYVRELERAAAQAVDIDVQGILAHDMAVIEGHKLIQDMQRRVWRCCRHCYGVNHKYQWIDEDEYCNALASAMDAAALRKDESPTLPTDVGGFGYDSHLSPITSCKACSGDGVQVTIFVDTRLLEGPAAAAFKGVKETKNGIEILTHDIDKAKERLLRAAGVFGDDAASVAKGAAAGAAVGAAAAQALAQRTASMTPEEKRKAYLSLVS